MKDPVGRGLIASIVGVMAINLIEILLTHLNISETPLWQAGGIVFLTERALQTPPGIAIGIFSHIFIGIVLGTSIAYYIYYSGTDFAVVKGVGLSLIAGFIVLTIIFPLRGLASEMQGNPADIISALIDHIVFGASVGYIIKYLQLKVEKKEVITEKKTHPFKVLLKYEPSTHKRIVFKKPNKI